MIIRTEEKEDFSHVYEVVKTAFATAEHADGNEQDLVVALRKSEAFIPELSLVAVEDGQIIGHIMFTKLRVGGRTELALAPLAVLPGCQKQGVGTALMREGHARAIERGFHYSVVLGSEKYYPRVGYAPAGQFGISAPFEVSSENFMALRLLDDGEKISGVAEYAKEFGI